MELSVTRGRGILLSYTTLVSLGLMMSVISLCKQQSVF